jgi:DNA-binding transcriptional regulator YdaS (Cro superfamily)
MLTGTKTACGVGMDSANVYSDTLRLAAETVGGSRALAKRLGISPDDLARWITDGKQVPLEPFLAALDILEGSTS